MTCYGPSCGLHVTDRSPSPWFHSERCQDKYLQLAHDAVPIISGPSQIPSMRAEDEARAAATEADRLRRAGRMAGERGMVA